MDGGRRMTEPSDGALVAAIRGGATARYAEVVRRFDARLRAIVAGLGVRDPGALEDIVQKSFYLAFRHLDRLASGDKLEAWLVRITTNCVAEHRRRTGRRSSESGEEAADRLAAPPARAAWIWEEVDSLDAPLAEIVRLRYERGLRYAEIAAELGIPASTVRGRLYEARKALRRRLFDT